MTVFYVPDAYTESCATSFPGGRVYTFDILRYQADAGITLNVNDSVRFRIPTGPYTTVAISKSSASGNADSLTVYGYPSGDGSDFLTEFGTFSAHGSYSKVGQAQTAPASTSASLLADIIDGYILASFGIATSIPNRYFGFVTLLER